MGLFRAVLGLSTSPAVAPGETPETHWVCAEAERVARSPGKPLLSWSSSEWEQVVGKLHRCDSGWWVLLRAFTRPSWVHKRQEEAPSSPRPSVGFYETVRHLSVQGFFSHKGPGRRRLLMAVP